MIAERGRATAADPSQMRLVTVTALGHAALRPEPLGASPKDNHIASRAGAAGSICTDSPQPQAAV